MPEPDSERVLAGPALGAADFKYHRPHERGEVDDLLAQYGSEARILAGGTDLLVQLRSGAQHPEHVVDLVDLEVPADIVLSGRHLRVDATTELWQLEAHPGVNERFTALVEGARCVGSLQIRNVATLVGNVCNASPAADTAPALLLYDTVALVRSRRGRRELPVSELWGGPRRTTLAEDEWVEQLVLTDPGPHGSCYVKLGRTRGVDLALVGIACLDTGDEVRVASASLAPTPRRMPAVERVYAESVETGAADLQHALDEDAAPISDVRAGAAYRVAMARVCCRRARERAGRRREEARHD
jgi:CO/xanthine dehydrogenase FAD-binding subunit